ncbi:calpain-5-like isoform X3 [Silurus meridionalis]|uniref:calpain-5-like isoform X3 n=1 Tax=Silurus meridionalis TaxID=175797 RepID=UPI001EEA8344|nr:calpain-5-like isoform X3 [Silurus meridionalis]
MDLVCVICSVFLPCCHYIHCRMPERVFQFHGQNYHKLKRACLRHGALFKDPHFPACNQSLFYKRTPPPGLTWKRPREMCKDPRLFVDGISTRDLHQGSLGNCWMVAATSCLATEPSLWKKVIPDHTEQEWNPKRPHLYAGIFHFRFWRLGQWMDVVVDDRLPVSEDGTLLFCRSATPREFWSALLEKAYAKLNGCYEALEGGNTAEALVDFTGGVSEPLSLDGKTLIQHSDQRRALFQTLSRAHMCKALITCSIRPAEGEQIESVLECGLVKGHAYGVTAFKKIRVGENMLAVCGTSRLYMVRMRNPWGTADWTGTWSQGMEFEDFCHYFTDMVVCRLVERCLFWHWGHWRETHCTGEWTHAPVDSARPSASRSFNTKKVFLSSRRALPAAVPRGDRQEERLSERQLHERRDHIVIEKKPGPTQSGERTTKKNEDEFQGNEERVVDERWEKEMDKRSRCGGCINHRETFLHNPQFMFDLGGEGDEVLICLQQEDRRMKRREGGGENLPIGFEVLRIEMNRVSRVQCFNEQAASSVYMDSRSITLRVTLDPGRYALLPTTFQPGFTGRFLLRLFSHTHVKLRELKEEVPAHSLWQCCMPQPCAVVTVHLHRASTFNKPKQPAPDVYALIKCEEYTIRTRVFKKNGSPEFNTKAIFYRRKPRRKICIEIWGRGLLFDSFLGRANFQTGASEHGRTRVIELQGGQSPGCIYVETSTSQCLTEL